MELKIYNSLTQKKELFKPLVAGEVKMYCCGPTVYDYLHVGNFRGAVFYNFVQNWLKKNGYKVNYVYNFTDVDDKILNRARTEGVSASEISERFIKEFWQDFNALKLTPHTHNPKVTEHMSEIVALIEKIISQGRAYVVEGEVFFAIDQFPDYGKLSHRRPEDMQSGARIEIDPKKRNPLDFTLWKPAKEGEQSWSSPWGQGRPGWHIECSAMTLALLGEQIDIHGGGMDLIFPHHENEIAQSEAASQQNYVRYWLHNNMFTFSGAKMSKSLGNIRTMRSFLEKYNGEIFKYLVLSVHYRSEAEFSEVTIQNSISALARIYSALNKAKSLQLFPLAEVPLASPEFKKLQTQIEKAQASITEFLNDDFSTPQAMAQIFDTIRLYNQLVPSTAKPNANTSALSQIFSEFLKFFGEPLALFQEDPEIFLLSLDDLLLEQKGFKRDEVNLLVQKRWAAREEKNYKLSDQLRDELLQMGIEIKDGQGLSTWEVKKS